MTSYTARFTFRESDESAAEQYVFPVVQSVNDPVPGMKHTKIEGCRADGSIIIPGGQKSIEISLTGILMGDLVEIQAAITAMRTDVTTEIGTLTFEYWDGDEWISIWSYTVQRVDEISFPESLRIDSQEYTVKFIVLSY